MDFKKLLKNNRLIHGAIILGAIGILLIFLSDFIGSANTDNITETEGTVNDELYCKDLEEDAKKLIKSITGDENVEVVITLQSGTEYVYATDKNVNTDTKENISNNEVLNNEISDKTQLSYIIINTSNGEQPLLLSALAPEVRGVAVVCDSGSDKEIAEAIKNSLCTLLDIRENKISVAGRKLK